MERQTGRAAAAVRVDLVDTIRQMAGSPSAQTIAAWLAHLTDEEVLDRMSRLQVTHTYDPDVVVRNVEVLEGLRNEALEFGHQAIGE